MGSLKQRVKRLEHRRAAARGPALHQITQLWAGGYEAGGTTYPTEAEAWASFGPAGPHDCRLFLIEQAPSCEEWEARAKAAADIEQT